MTQASDRSDRGWRVALAGAIIAVVAFIAYSDSFRGPFVLDDIPSIVSNPAVHQFWPPWAAMAPPAESGITVSGRPLVALSLAANYTVGGQNVTGYHGINLVIHILAGLVLFGLARRTLAEIWGSQAGLSLGFAVALLWTVHPLQTESVTYVIQRAESLMGLFYLLTVYGFVRAVRSSGNRKVFVNRSENLTVSATWKTCSVACCFFGMACKEVMVSAPLIVLLYDRAFVSGTLRAAWRLHWRYYLALASTWIFQAFLVFGAGNRGGTAGLGTGVDWARYLGGQLWVLGRYLRLAVWPDPLIFDYGQLSPALRASLWPGGLVVLALLAGTVLSFRRFPRWSFLGLWFFAVLAPTSLLPQARQTASEHRMYLALAPVLAALVAGAYALRSLRRPPPDSLRPPGRLFLATVALIALLLTVTTFVRNFDYRSAYTLAADTVEKLPTNAFAQSDLGLTLKQMGRLPEAIAHYETAVRLQPALAEAQNNLGVALGDTGRQAEGIAHLEEAVRIRPNYAEAYSNLGKLCFQIGQTAEAEADLRKALALRPDLAVVHLNLGSVLAATGRLDDAERQFRSALALDPNNAGARANLARVLVLQGRAGPVGPTLSP